MSGQPEDMESQSIASGESAVEEEQKKEFWNVVDEKSDDFDAKTHKLEPITQTKFEEAVSDIINETKLNF